MPHPHQAPLRQLLVSGVALLLTSAGFAQTGAQTGAPASAPTSTETAKPALPSKLHYTSPLRAYKAYADQPVEPWREANDRVGRIGGWRAYAREIQTGEPAKDLPREPATTPAAPAGAPAVPAKTPEGSPKAPAPANPHAGHHGGAKR